ncbi:hypothetical protein [Cyanobium sp. HWJ4-Hawea]|uniref:hypothetical protein n=1 Tax=Cyanobium sp. HWJ4-Hawea TaxID=2823713 RepID=UPI0020CECF14|nr:hypothetical protein [Cyanobium sp. HWJ4-Hawea]
MPRVWFGLLGLIGGIGLAGGATLGSAWAAAPTPQQLQGLERAFNGAGELSLVLEPGPGLDPALVEMRRRVLLKQFPDAQWQVSPGAPLRDGSATTQVKVTGHQKAGPHAYTFEAVQRLALGSDGGRINSQRVIEEQSVLHSSDSQLPVSLLIPDAVLTGQRYDVDVLFDEPLAGSVLAGGLAAISDQMVTTMASPSLPLGALGGGGLFKTVQAPLSPGSQTWAVLLVHPKGIVTATKRVRVVADRDALNP